MSKRRFPLNKFPELLKNPPPDIDIMLYDRKGKESIHHSKDNTMKKPTLSQRLDKLTEVVMNGFKQVNARLDKVEQRLDKVEQRLDKVEQRLDKVEQRLDKVEQRLDKVEQRLDYNNLKRLPE